jgi:hypothetical protein
MSIHISVESIQGKQRKDIVKEIQQRAKKEALVGVKEVLEAGFRSRSRRRVGKKERRNTTNQQPTTSDRVDVWALWLPRCQSVPPGWTLQKKFGDVLGAYRGITYSHARVSTVFS